MRTVKYVICATGILVSMAGYGFDLGKVAKGAVKVVAAPVVAPVHVVENVVQGKAPSVSDVIATASPTLAQVAKADDELGISQAAGQAEQVPAQVNQTLRDTSEAAKGVGEAAKNASQLAQTSNKFVEQAPSQATAFRLGMQGEVSSFLGSISTPLNIVLWGLAALICVKFLKAIFGKRQSSP